MVVLLFLSIFNSSEMSAMCTIGMVSGSSSVFESKWQQKLAKLALPDLLELVLLFRCSEKGMHL